jgi:spore maturation protein CgeB
MRIMFLYPDYAGFIRWLYETQPGLEAASYEQQMQARNASLFGVADACSRSMRRLGHEAVDVYVNNRIMQQTWASEHSPSSRGADTGPNAFGILRSVGASVARGLLPPRARDRLRRGLALQPRRDHQLEDILVEQVRHYQPDVVLNTALDSTHPATLERLKPFTRLLVGQVASPIEGHLDLSAYDLIVTSMPHLMERFAAQGIPSRLLRLGFDTAVLQAVPAREQDIPVSFVGALTRDHGSRIRWLEQVCAAVDVAVWGSGVEQLSTHSPIRKNYRGEAWGIEMFRILGRSRITLNHHIDMAGSNANNMRLFEATGMGALLLTDRKDNLSDLFEPGREVVAYDDAADCIRCIDYYSAHEDERQIIARKGQARTIAEHNYLRRMTELLDILESYV